MSTLSEIPVALVGSIAAKLAEWGRQVRFWVVTFAAIPLTIRKYHHEIGRILSEIAFGTGAIVVGGSTIGVVVLLSAMTGAGVGLSGYVGLNAIGLAPLSGFISAYGNTRELAPLVGAIAFAAHVGSRFTAQLGSMRISEEIDAIEVMAIRSLPYMVTTRVLAALIAVVPMYLVALFSSYGATQVMITGLFHQSSGTYQHYFRLLISPSDVIYSVVKIMIFCVAVTMIHCYHGYNAKGGPEGVGRATGTAIRTSIIVVTVLDMVLSLLFWGSNPGISITG